MAVIEQDAWAYPAGRTEPESIHEHLPSRGRSTESGAGASLPGLLLGWLLLGPPPALERPSTGPRRSGPSL